MNHHAAPARPSAASIRRLLAPRSIAIIGASPTQGALGYSVLQNLERAGYAGTIHLVNPKRSDIAGRPCVPSVADLPRDVDCAVFAIPNAGVIEAMQQCGARGVGGAVIFSAGYAEENAEGRAAQEEITAIAVQHGMVVEGPNCLGMVNFVDGVPLSFVDMPGARLGDAPGIGIVSQSGALAAVVTVGLLSRGLGLSYFISTGNEAASGIEDYLDYLIQDAHTPVIALVVEQFRDPARFLALANEAQACGKKIVLLHPGRSSAAQQSAATHTGAMAGDYAAMRLKVQTQGVIFTETLEEFLDVSELLLRCPPPTGTGAAILTESGAFRGLSLDFCDQIGLALPPPSASTAEAWRAVLPSFVHIANPLDLTAQGLVDPGIYERTLLPLLADPAYGAVIISIILTNEATSSRKLAPIAAALGQLRLGKPVVLAAMDEGAAVAREHVAALRAAGVPFFPSTERAYRAIGRILSGSIVPATAPIGLPGADALSIPPGVMTEHDAKQVLAAIGVAIPAGGLATTPEAAIGIAARIGYPVVIKAQASAMSHKSDVGGVLLNITDDAALRAAWTKLHGNIAQARPGLVLDGVLVETMARRGMELIVGARRDPDWGPVLLIGAGGVLAEAMRDVRLIRPDLSAAAIADELLALRAGAVLRGFRGSPALDVTAAAELVAKIGQLMLARPDIVELDINPVVVWPHGEGALALDALIVGG